MKIVVEIIKAVLFLCIGVFLLWYLFIRYYNISTNGVIFLSLLGIIFILFSIASFSFVIKNKGPKN
ncbi:MAG: hypothetical protein LBR70_05815 [Lactobacillaceae bacterium]|nr:hypothetical protein [Lactobacillaceae bacterium]